MSSLPPNSNPTSLDFIIRPAHPEDAAGIARVHILSWQAAYRGLLPQSLLDQLSIELRTRQWQQWLEASHPQFNLLAQADQQIIGFVSGGPVRGNYPDYDCEIAAIYLLPEAQGSGCGKALFNSMQRLFTQQGYQHLLVWVLESNHKARGFYQALGGLPLMEKTVTIAGAEQSESVEVVEVAYTWNLSV